MKIALIVLYVVVLFDLIQSNVLTTTLALLGFTAGYALAAFLIMLGLSCEIPVERRRNRSLIASLGGFDK